MNNSLVYNIYLVIRLKNTSIVVSECVLRDMDFPY